MAHYCGCQKCGGKEVARSTFFLHAPARNRLVMTDLLEKNERASGSEDENDSRASSDRSRSSSLEPRPKRRRHDTSTPRNSFDDLEEPVLSLDFQDGTAEKDIQGITHLLSSCLPILLCPGS
jgi:hypothetical protein